MDSTKNSNSLEDILKGSKALVVSDLHHNLDVFNETLQYADDYGLAVISNGDDFNDYNFLEVANSLGYQLPSMKRYDFLSKKLSDKDLEALMIREEIGKYGIENFLNVVIEENQIPKEQVNGLVSQIEDVVKYSETELFQKRINEVEIELMQEKGDEILSDQLHLRALYEVITHRQAKDHAQMLDKYQDVKVFANKGNHESIAFYQLVKEYMSNPDNLTVLDEQEGYTDINGLKTAGMSNSIHTMPYLSEIFSPEEITQLYPHLGDENLYKILSQEETIDKEKLRGLEKALLEEDKEYQRITKNGSMKDEELDLFLSHGQVGKAYLDKEKEGNIVPYRLSSALLSDRAKLLIEGHIHSNYEGENSFGDEMIRPGNLMYAISKDENGNVTYDAIPFSKKFDSHKGIEYDLDTLKQEVEQVVGMYKQMLNVQKQAS